MSPPPYVEPELVYRTPTDRFDSLPGYPYRARFSTWGNLRYAYLDVEGPLLDVKSGSPVDMSHSEAHHKVRTETVLCLHGEPTWSYLYRKMIPGFLNQASPRPHASEDNRYIRRRVLVPDLIGFGQSDKPIEDDFYTFDMHRDWLLHFVTQHIVEDDRTRQGGRVTLVVQGKYWGGILGLLLPSLFPSLFTHLIVMNTGLGLGKMPSEGWINFRDYIKRSPDVDVGALLARGTPLSNREVAAYSAPFQGERTKAGVRRFPQLVPVHPSMRGVPDSYAALAYFNALPPAAFTSNTLAKPSAPQGQGRDSGQSLGSPLSVFFVVGKADPVLGEPVMQALAKRLFGASTGYYWHVIPEGGHFVQEWSEHVPGLADRAWSSAPTAGASIVYDGHKAVWVAPSPSSKSKL